MDCVLREVNDNHESGLNKFSVINNSSHPPFTSLSLPLLLPTSYQAKKKNNPKNPQKVVQFPSSPVYIKQLVQPDDRWED